MENAGDDMETYARIDTDFHTLLAETTRNSLLVWMIGQINNVPSHKQWGRMRILTLDQVTTKMYNRQHRDILEAIRARSPESAAARMKNHLESARLSLTRAAET